VQIQKDLPAGSGTGYRLLAGNDVQGARLEAGYALQTDVGNASVEVGQVGRSTAYRLTASGGVGLVEGHGFLSRRLSESFGLAQVPGYPGIGVYVNQQLVGRTDAQGLAVVPRLLPYQRNALTIESTELPLDADIRSTQVEASPYFRSGLLFKFDVQRTRSALVTIELEGGSPLPVGAVVRLGEGTEEFPVAQRGEVYITGVAATNRIQALWKGQTCTMDFELPTADTPIQHAGPLRCAGVKP
jgi:outer membrane usher protein